MLVSGKPPAKPFEPINLPKKSLGSEASSSETASYLVYRNREEFVKIAAETAPEAIEKSGIPKPYKVLRVTAGAMHILPPDFLKKS